MFSARWAQPVEAFLVRNPMLGSLLVSLVLHTVMLTLWLSWTAMLAAPSLLANPDVIDQNLARARQAMQETETLVFVEVLPEQQTEETPENTKYYSSANARAANPDPEPPDQTTPKIEGEQTELVRTIDNSQPQPLQPTPPPEPAPEPVPEPEAEPEPEPPPEPDPQDVALLKPSIERPEPAPRPEPKPERPRRLSDLTQAQDHLVGRRMQQDGGVERRARIAAFDTRATPFGEYDWRIIKAIEARWHGLLDNRNFTRDRVGKVVLEFRMHPDGRVTDMRIAGNEVGELLSLLCQKAIMDNTPYEPWPRDLRLMVPGDYREVRFTFIYE